MTSLALLVCACCLYVQGCWKQEKGEGLLRQKLLHYIQGLLFPKSRLAVFIVSPNEKRNGELLYFRNVFPVLERH